METKLKFKAFYNNKLWVVESIEYMTYDEPGVLLIENDFDEDDSRDLGDEVTTSLSNVKMLQLKGYDDYGEEIYDDDVIQCERCNELNGNIYKSYCMGQYPIEGDIMSNLVQGSVKVIGNINIDSKLKELIK